MTDSGTLSCTQMGRVLLTDRKPAAHFERGIIANGLSVMLARVDLAKYEDKEKAFSMGEGTIEEIKYLLGTPDFSSGKRKGDIQF